MECGRRRNSTFSIVMCERKLVVTLQFLVELPPEAESRTQGSRPRPSTQKKSEAKAKDSPSEDRLSRGRGQECLRPRTQAQVFSKKKKVFKQIFQAIYKILTMQKILLSSSRGQGKFPGLEASRPRPRT